MSLEDLDSLSQFRLAVAAGLYDADLDSIQATVTQRRKLLQAAANANLVASLSVGDRVCITDKVSPKYLSNNYGTVREIHSDGMVSVTMDLQIRRFSREIKFYPQRLRKVTP